MRREDLGHLRRVLTRVIGAQQEALDAADRGLEFGQADPEDDAQLLEANERLEAALADVRDILGGASDDVREMLGDDGSVA